MRRATSSIVPPASPISSAAALPIPDEAPVIITVRPVDRVLERAGEHVAGARDALAERAQRADALGGEVERVGWSHRRT